MNFVALKKKLFFFIEQKTNHVIRFHTFKVKDRLFNLYFLTDTLQGDGHITFGITLFGNSYKVECWTNCKPGKEYLFRNYMLFDRQHYYGIFDRLKRQWRKIVSN